MKKTLSIFILLLLLTSCWSKNQDDEEITVKSGEKIENKITIKNNIYSKTTKITFHDPKDIEKFNKELADINKEISSNTGAITYNQIISKARLLGYLWKTGEALKLYVDNFEKNMNNKSLAYNHNMAKLYEKLWEPNLALKKYIYIISHFKKFNYFKDIANIWKQKWNEKKYNKAMNAYSKYMKKNKTQEGVINLSESGVLELK